MLLENMVQKTDSQKNLSNNEIYITACKIYNEMLENILKEEIPLMFKNKLPVI